MELGGRDRLLAEIEGLPDTYVKKLLQERVKPYFLEDTVYPLTLERADGEFKFRVYGAEVAQEKLDVLRIGGRLSPRSGVPTTSFRPEVETSINIPLLFGPTEDEARQRNIPPEFRLPDGSGYFATVRYTVDRNIYDGLKPEMLIRTPRADIIPPNERDYYSRVEKFVYIKEASSMLFYDLVMEETFRRMENYGFDWKLRAKGPNGLEEIEMVNKALTDLGRTGGRILALADLAGYYLAMKAFESDEEMKAVLSRDPAIKPVLETLSEYSYEQSPFGLISAIESWALREPSVRGLHYLGDLDQFPMNITPATEYEFALDSENNLFTFNT